MTRCPGYPRKAGWLYAVRSSQDLMWSFYYLLEDEPGPGWPTRCLFWQSDDRKFKILPTRFPKMPLASGWEKLL